MLSRVWQHASAGGVLFPVVYRRRDSGRWSAPVHRVASRSAHIAVGAGHGRDQARGLSIWAPGPRREPPSGHMCAPVPAQPQRRGVSDRRGGTSRTGAKRAGECDGLTGLPEAIEATWPQATVPTCVVHPVPCPWMRFVSYGDRRKVAAALKTDLHRPEPGGRLAGPDRLLRVRHGGQVPPDGGDLGAGLGEVHPVPGLPADAQACHLSPTSWEVPPPPTRSRLRATSYARITDEPRPLPLR